MAHTTFVRRPLWTVALSMVLVMSLAACAGAASDSAGAAQPWGKDVVAPADLLRELAGTSGKPVVICTAPAFLYRQGHIPGSVFTGPASTPEGLQSLTKWAGTVPTSTNVVIYCGCCPLQHCPNLAPAYTALKGLGFTRVRVLILPDSFGTDWVANGFPIAR